ncbi:unnamed protein product [Lactuca saligna]|uniref:FBD domain-containing protein n=1 Tax=Lactuca saligna TaxID=75948 RepID=A0AA35ZPW7_LACSI|nr:unnamed protein product [Lactuca saligna]
MVFPRWSDQGTTNAKMMEDVWRTGVRVRKREINGVVEEKEIERSRLFTIRPLKWIVLKRKTGYFFRFPAARSYQNHKSIRNKMGRRGIRFKKDHISDLPQSIIETILTKMPLRDAVRTSILSSKWRYKWATLTHLEFDDKCVSGTHSKSHARSNLVNFITRFLFLHDGPINGFALSTTYLRSSPNIDQWLLFLSRKDVKELVLEFGKRKLFRAPSCLYSCQKLVRLKIVNWELAPPLSFKGFPFLKHLILKHVSIAPYAIENLISGCIIISGVYSKASCYMCQPAMSNIISSCNFDKFLGGALSLERFIGRDYFTLYTSIGNTIGKTQMKYQQLKVIQLYEVSFENIKEVTVVVRFILNAPNLEELHISGSWESLSATEAPDLDFWEKECPSDSTFERLKIVKMTHMNGFRHEIGLIGFLLGSSPVLKTMSITPGVYMTEDKSSFLIELLRFKRASTEAEIIFVKDEV